MPAEPQVNILMVDDTPNNLFVLEATLGDLGQNLVRGRLRRGGAATPAQRRLRADPDGRPDARHGRLRGRRADPPAGAHAAHPDHLPDRLRAHRLADVPGLLRRRRRLPVQADRAGGAPLQGPGVRGPALGDGAGPAPGRAAPRERAPGDGPPARRGAAAGRGGADADPASGRPRGPAEAIPRRRALVPGVRDRRDVAPSRADRRRLLRLFPAAGRRCRGRHRRRLRPRLRPGPADGVHSGLPAGPGPDQRAGR